MLGSAALVSDCIRQTPGFVPTASPQLWLATGVECGISSTCNVTGSPALARAACGPDACHAVALAAGGSAFAALDAEGSLHIFGDDLSAYDSSAHAGLTFGWVAVRLCVMVVAVAAIYLRASVR